jgi:hypothetical protein
VLYAIPRLGGEAVDRYTACQSRLPCDERLQIPVDEAGLGGQHVGIHAAQRANVHVRNPVIGQKPEDEFLATDDWVELTAGFRAKGLTELCNPGGWLLETENPASRATAAFMADVEARRTPAKRAALAARQQVVQKAARVLRASPMAVMLAARQLWGRSLGAERDRRLGGDGAAQAKGHVTRQLYAELAAVLNSAPISGAQGAREVPDRPRKSRSKVPGKVPERLTARKRPHK